MIQLEWKGRMSFDATMPDGTGFRIDTNEASGGDSSGPSPVEALLSAIAGCMAMDVIAILLKKRQKVAAYRIEVEHTRTPEGVYPRPVASVTLKHILEGEDIDEGAVQRAIELSEEKYCSVLATLKQAPEVRSEMKIAAKA